MSNSQAVIGLGFGDEGKGKVVSYLCSQSPESLVVRFCGGQQAGHHVILKEGEEKGDVDIEHVFANFGSGTLQGNHTYWSEFCTFDPVGFHNEWNILSKKGYTPIISVNENCPVTTPYEKEFNMRAEEKRILKHGTCGVGVGQTWQREEDRFSIKVRDIFHLIVLRMKLEVLKRHHPAYKHYNHQYIILRDAMEEFYDACNKVRNYLSLVTTIPKGYDNYIFEGSQGLLLDQDIGFFPHVARTNTGLKNIFKMGFDPQVFLVTRAYQTRHGNGPMTNENIPHTIKVNPYEQNPDDNMQGKFRRTLLDLDLIKYVISGDRRIKSEEATLVITCLDLIDEYKLTSLEGVVSTFDTESVFVDFIQDILGIKNVLIGTSPLSHELRICPERVKI